MGGTSLAALKSFAHSLVGPRSSASIHAAIDALDQATLQPVVDYSQATQLRQASLLLVCIGDSLRNIGFGGGGNIELLDANELVERRRGWSTRPRAVRRCDVYALEEKMIRHCNEFCQSGNVRAVGTPYCTYSPQPSARVTTP